MDTGGLYFHLKKLAFDVNAWETYIVFDHFLLLNHTLTEISTSRSFSLLHAASMEQVSADKLLKSA